MKIQKYSVIFFLAVSFFDSAYAEKCTSAGQVTEALFIVQNKQRELSEYIQSLKKKLTDCFARQKKLLEAGTCSVKSSNEWELSHCALYQRILPNSIKELELLSKNMIERITLFSQDVPVKDYELKNAVDQAFLIKEKTMLEAELIDLLTSIDKNECEIKQSKKGKQRNVQGARRSGAFKKRKLKVRKSELAKINNRLYKEKECKPEKTFLDDLASYIP